jgi:hypothetical protein
MMYPFAAAAVRQQSSAELRERFQDALHNAITRGRNPLGELGFGPRTQAAVRLAAAEHPDAGADLIADAYDAFAQEHCVTDQPNPHKPPLTTVRTNLRSRRQLSP